MKLYEAFAERKSPARPDSALVLILPVVNGQTPKLLDLHLNLDQDIMEGKMCTNLCQSWIVIQIATKI